MPEIADRVLWLEDGRFKTLDALVRDPVCGMLLEPGQVVAEAQRDLSHVQDLIAGEGDCLVALALLAHAARNADDAVFVLWTPRQPEVVKIRGIYP